MKIRTLVFILILAFLLITFNKLTGFISFTSSDSCQDSDLGKTPEVRGDVRGTSHNTVTDKPEDYIYEDHCEKNVLIEYYCSEEANPRTLSAKYECKERCEGGICIGGSIEKRGFMFPSVIIAAFVLLILWYFGILKKVLLGKKRR
jgi:hypothetical protein